MEEKTILKGVLDDAETLVQVSSLRPRTGGGGSKFSSSKTHGFQQGQRWGEVKEGMYVCCGLMCL